MKRRNQLVSILLAGALIAGTASAAGGATAQDAMAAISESTEALQELSGTSEETAAVSENPGSGAQTEAQETASSAAEQAGSSGEYGEPESSGSGSQAETGSDLSGAESSESGAESGSPQAEPGGNSVTPAVESAASSAETEAEAAESTESVAEVTTAYPGGYVYTGGGYAYLDADYHYLSDDERRAYLRYGFRQIDRVCAVAEAPEYVNIRAGKDTEAAVVGTLKTGGLCYVLADQDEAWIYVESGEVRGFVSREFLITGKKADQIVKKNGEENLVTAETVIDPIDNPVFRYSMNTVYEVSDLTPLAGASVSREELTAFAGQLAGTPYVWNGNSLTEGTDSAGLARLVYEHFGVTIPTTSFGQSSVGERILAEDAEPGDLIFYAKNGVVYHTVIYLGDGQILDTHAGSGAVVKDLEPGRACWAVRLIGGTGLSMGETDEIAVSAPGLQTVGVAAADGDEAAKQQVIASLAAASEKEWKEYGFCRSVIIAQSILESGWCTFPAASHQGVQASDNNVLGMNADLMNDRWTSPWTGESADRLVPSVQDGKTVWNVESMRTYPTLEACMEDYAAFKTGLHPSLKGETDVDTVLAEALGGYDADSEYLKEIRGLIDEYDLTQYDGGAVVGSAAQTDGNGPQTEWGSLDTSVTDNGDGTYTCRADTADYSEEELQLIWAVVAEEDDSCYNGALAVISSVMNRADVNFGGYGTDALSQITAEGQYCYSSEVKDPIFYQRRLGGNVPDFVKQAVSDCLTGGLRNHLYRNLSRGESGAQQVGGRWYSD